MAVTLLTRHRPLLLAAVVVGIFWTMQWVTLLTNNDDAPLQVQSLHRVLRSEQGEPPAVVSTTGYITTDTSTHDDDNNAQHCASLKIKPKSSFIDYESLVHCTSLRDSIPSARTALVVILVVLLYLLSSTADSFFCPVLQAIVEKYRIPPDIAGVTFLSFGNGSPDVFSNIAAFSTSTPKIGVTSILGGGLLVTTVIVASVGLASQDQDQLIPRKFVRDVVFYFLAIAYFGLVFIDGLVGLPEALGFLAIYLCYVVVILFDAKIARLYYSLWGYDNGEIDDFCEPRNRLLSSSSSYWSASSQSDKSIGGGSDSEAGTPGPAMVTSYEVYRIPNYTASDSSDSETLAMPTLFRKSSAPTPRTKQNVTENGYETPSPSGESTPLLWQRQLATRPASFSVRSLPLKKRRLRNRTAWEATQMSAHFNLTAKRWTRGYQHELGGIAEFPSVSETGDEIDEELDGAGTPQHGGRRSSSGGDVDGGGVIGIVEEVVVPSQWERYLFRWFPTGYWLFETFIWNPLELSTTFLRRLTIPLIDDETWDKSFAMVCPPAAVVVIGMSVFALDPLTNATFAVAIITLGGAGSVFVHLTSTHESPPEGPLLAPYICLAFAMSVIWIMNIANEVLALLKVLGGLFGISNSVLGVSVLAWGNSIGDLVSNTSIARDGFPTMAFAGCFAGPMFNLLVGIGLALTISILSHGPVVMSKPSLLVNVGFAFLFASLLVNLGFAALDNFRYRPRLCYALLALYVLFVVLSIAIVATEHE